MSLRTLPKKLYARIDKSDDDPLLLAYETLDEVVEEEGVTKVGVYQLVVVESYRQKVELVKEG